MNSKPDFFTAIDLTTAEVESGMICKIIETQFGDICFECIEGRPMETVHASAMEDGPDNSSWFLQNRKRTDIEHYVSIVYKPNQDRFLTKIEIIRAFSNCLLRHFSKDKGSVRLEDSDPIALACLDAIDCSYHDISRDIASSIISRDGGKFVKFMPKYNELLIRNTTSAVSGYLSKARAMLKHYKMISNRCQNIIEYTFLDLPTFWKVVFFAAISRNFNITPDYYNINIDQKEAHKLRTSKESCTIIDAIEKVIELIGKKILE